MKLKEIINLKEKRGKIKNKKINNYKFNKYIFYFIYDNN